MKASEFIELEMRWHCGLPTTVVSERYEACEMCGSVYDGKHSHWFSDAERVVKPGKQNHLTPVRSWIFLDEPYERDEVAQTLVAKSRAVGGMSLDEVGKALGISHEGCRILQGGAMRKLRRRLAQMPDGARILDHLRTLEAVRRERVYPEGGL